MSETIDLTLGLWAGVELLGHRVVRGYLREVEMFGAKLLEVTVPEHYDYSGGKVEERVQYYGAGALYCLTPSSEEEVRRALNPRRVQISAANSDGRWGKPAEPFEYVPRGANGEDLRFESQEDEEEEAENRQDDDGGE